MTITGMHHTVLTVTDVARSQDFYGGLLGLELFKAVPDDGVAGEKVIYRLADGTFFGVVAHAKGDGSAFSEMRTGLDHISFAVPAAELDSWRERLSAAGVPSAEPAPALSGELVFVVRDPDNIAVQIFGKR